MVPTSAFPLPARRKIIALSGIKQWRSLKEQSSPIEKQMLMTWKEINSPLPLVFNTRLRIDPGPLLSDIRNRYPSLSPLSTSIGLIISAALEFRLVLHSEPEVSPTPLPLSIFSPETGNAGRFHSLSPTARTVGTTLLTRPYMTFERIEGEQRNETVCGAML